ncbi:MAG: hypothetical protein K2M55_02935, partial [Muribaculaceae bacterium]|nr:hypothetical protein [Muribaculaceae bacterium]
MTKPPLSQFDDIHSHSLRGPRVITSIDAADLLAAANDRGTEADLGALLAGIVPDNESQAWYSIG